MPTYDYKCAACGHVFEEFQPITAEPLTVCPRCGTQSLRRGLGGGAGMIFKGEGFYLTDYKKNGGSKESKKTEPSSENASPPKADSGEKKP